MNANIVLIDHFFLLCNYKGLNKGVLFVSEECV